MPATMNSLIGPEGMLGSVGGKRLVHVETHKASIYERLSMFTLIIEIVQELDCTQISLRSRCKVWRFALWHLVKPNAQASTYALKRDEVK